MKHFQIIEKKWKSVESKRCSQCGKNIEKTNDWFIITAHWKIKNKADERTFCSLICCEKWCKEDEDN